MSSYKTFKSEGTVKARLQQYERTVSNAEHASKHSDQLRKRRKNGSASSSNISDEYEADGSMDFADFVRAFTADGVTGVSEKDALLEAFRILDCDDDGFITMPDLREAIGGFEEDEEEEESRMTDEDLKEMIAAADDQGNGKISFESFIRILEPNKSGTSTKKHSKEKFKG